MAKTPFTDLVAKAIRRPHRIPPYVLGRLFPNSRFGPNWKYQDGLITFTNGGFVSSPSNRPEFAAKLHGEVAIVNKMLADVETVDAALEVGCGYGRLTPWISEFADEMHAIDINEEALASASELHPQIEFWHGRADDLPHQGEAFDLVFAWTVLQHISSDNIIESSREISRVLGEEGYILICERTRGAGQNTWARSPEDYEELFGATLVESVQKPMEETWDGPSDGPPEDVMLFRAN